MSAVGAGHPRWVTRPRRGVRRTLTTVALSLLLAAALLVAITKATPAYASACAGKKGITVVVDFSKLHGKVRIGCDHNKPSTGLAALRGAGFKYTFVPRRPGFVCTINHRPKNCNGAPTSAYWSYWHASPHGKWKYSTLGAGSFHPKAGSVEGWAFGKGKPPKISPP